MESRVRNRFLLALLAGLYPSAFFASNNWYGFTSTQILVLIASVSLAAFAAVSVLSAAFGLVLRPWARRRPSGKGGPADAFHALVALAACLFLSGNLYRGSSLHPAIVWTAVVGLVLAGACWAYLKGLKPLTLLLSGLTAITAAQWTYSYLDIFVRLRSDHWHNQHRETNELVHFSRTPNVYYILMESYPSRRALKEIFKVDGASLYDKLEARGFTLYHDAFSNYHATVSSLSSVFAMNHHYERIAVGNLDSYSARDVISARIYNAVVDVFQRNGYFVQYVHESDYQLREGAAVDFVWPDVSKLSALESFLEALGRLIPDTEGVQIRGRPFLAAVDARLSAIAHAEQPHFTYLYIPYPGHSSSELGDDEKGRRALKRFRNHYRWNLLEADRPLMDLVDRILAVDEEALIVVGGDHGAWGWRLEAMGNGGTVAPRTIGLDRLGILLAIRFPSDYDGRFDRETITNVNLFRYVFAYLAHSDQILETKVPDDGYIRRIGRPMEQAVEGGRLLETLVPQEP